ncbi:hypothetical protein [Streptomyces sp. DT9]
MRHAARRKPGRAGTTIKATAVSAFALGSLVLTVESQAHAATETSHSTAQNDSVRAEKEKAVAVARASHGSSSVLSEAEVRALKEKAVAVARASHH